MIHLLKPSDRIDNCLRKRGVQWYFNPLSASHAGGVWERIIRSIREILRSLLGDQLTDDETLLTFIADVEKIIKDRPLTPPTGDRNDLELLGSLSYKKSLQLAQIRLPEVNV